MLLEVRGLTLRFGGLTALHNVDLDVDAGELVALIGPNGAGKTSFLNCVSGFHRPTAGRIRLGTLDLTGWPVHKVAAAGVARTFQHAELFGNLTVGDNVMLGRHAHFQVHPLLDALYWGPVRREARAQRDAIQPMLDILDLARVVDTPAHELPYARQKLVGLARALAMQPALLLLDEPSAGLHHEAKQAFGQVLLCIQHKLQVPMLWIEHDMQLVSALATRVAVLNFGELVAVGSPREVLRDPEVARVYLGSVQPTE
jgi:branched-chain amino acid transport system ATP-binding protein